MKKYIQPSLIGFTLANLALLILSFTVFTRATRQLSSQSHDQYLELIKKASQTVENPENIIITKRGDLIINYNSEIDSDVRGFLWE